VVIAIRLGSQLVMRGLDPRIHPICIMMDCRIEPGNDDRGLLKPRAGLGKARWAGEI
jgi:hypothetical protein